MTDQTAAEAGIRALDGFLRAHAVPVHAGTLTIGIADALLLIDSTDAPEGTPPGELQRLAALEEVFYGSDGTSGVIGALYAYAQDSSGGTL